MHEYAITVSDHLAEKRLMLYRIRFSGHGKKRKRAGGDSCADEEAHAAARYRGAEDALLDMPSSQQPICSSSAVVEDNYNGHDCIDGDQDAASVTAPDEHGLNPFIDDNGELDVNAALDYFMEIAAHQEPDIQDIIYCTKLLAPTPPYYSVGANLVASPTQEDVLLDMPSSQQPICSSSAVVEDNSNGRDCIDGDQDAASVTAPDEHGLTPFIDDNGELDVNAALDYFMDIAAHQEPDIQDIIYCTKLLAPTPPYYSVGANLDALLDMPSLQQPICSSSAVVEDNFNGRDCIDGDQDAASATAPDEHGLTPFIDDNGELDVGAALDYFMEIAAHKEPDIQDIIYWTKFLGPTPPYSSVGASLVASPTQGRNFWMPRSCLNSAYRCLRDWPSSTWLNTPRGVYHRDLNENVPLQLQHI
ncbi:hypothetical protein U9M48_012551 [Paspalum notatum var. saurae]|uniref:Uncharacterized protein n=1 Tax=Paspalum notatum var. saurae TaxID=547442 RepID=A0AAQ3WI93_PASNO